MDEIIVRNLLSWLKLLIKLLLLHLVGCLYYYSKDARSHKHQILSGSFGRQIFPDVSSVTCRAKFGKGVMLGPREKLNTTRT